MKTNVSLFCRKLTPLLLASALFLAGCQSTKTSFDQQPQQSIAPPPTTAASVPVVDAVTLPPVRINAGCATAWTDADGNAWLPDQGFDGGDTVDRGDDVVIENTKKPTLYRTEHWGMSTFSCKLPNGKYSVKLHFCETFDGITGPGQRVFSFNVEGHQFKNFDVWAKAGGPRKAYVETVNVDVADGKLDITFTSDIDNPEINAIEILPTSAVGKP
jgi:hypothetical protein